MAQNNSALVDSTDQTGIVNAGPGGTKIQIHGTIDAQKAINELSKFGLISFSRDQTFKSSKFSIHFFKPVKKLKELYNLGDEILVVCGNNSMTMFKSRVKDFIDYILYSTEEYKNRLDKVSCFVIDYNKDISEIIGNDRIENPSSRLIVPFSYAEMIAGLTDEILQARLRSVLYERDLFGLNSPLQDDVLFFGKQRSVLIADLYGKYRQGEHGGLFGLRRIGKTSILNLLRNRIDKAGGEVAYFDCTKYHFQKWNSFLHQIIIDIANRYKNINEELRIALPQDFELPLDASRYNETEAPISFENDLLSLYRALNNKRILLIFDEIEAIGFSTSPSLHWKEQNDALYFWQAMRSVFQTHPYLMSFIITGVNPKIIELSKINEFDNPIFNALTAHYISLFDYDDVKTMVSSIGRYVGLHFEEEIYTRLVDDYGGHPFLIRQVCSQMNKEILENHEERPFIISKYRYEKHSEDYQAQMTGVIEQILGVLQEHYPNEYELLKILALDGSAAFKRKIQFGNNNVAAHLLGYCLIKKVEGDYYINIKSILKYLRDKYRYDKTLTSWEDKRTRIGLRRNDIEQKLRKLISANLQMKYGRKAKEQLVSQVRKTTKDTSQIDRMSPKDFKGAMNELYFSQLKLLIKDSWPDYQNLFNDRVKFEHFFDTINSYRADAHSKELSEEDEAILNISFKFFEACLADI